MLTGDPDWEDFQPRAVTVPFIFSQQFFGRDAEAVFSRHGSLFKRVDKRTFQIRLDGLEDSVAAIHVDINELREISPTHFIAPSIEISFNVEINYFENIEEFWRFSSDTDVSWDNKVDYWLELNSEDIASRILFFINLLYFLSESRQELGASLSYIFMGRHHPISFKNSNLLLSSHPNPGQASALIDYFEFLKYYDEDFFSGRPNMEGVKYYFEEMLVPNHQRDLLLDISFLFALLESLYGLGEGGKISELRGKIRAAGIDIEGRDWLREAYQVRSMFVHGGLGELNHKAVENISKSHKYLCHLVRETLLFMFGNRKSFLEFEWRLK